ncbi:MAG: hypothetical protein ACOYMH_12225, partial [Zwartia sp.]
SEQFPGTVSVGFAGLFAPKATPAAIVQKVASDVQNIVADPSFQQAVVDKGSVPDLRTKEQWTIFLADLTTKYSDLVKSGKVKVAE